MIAGSEVTVDVVAVRGTAEAMGGYREAAATIATAADAADISPHSWGLVGAMTTYPTYVEMLADAKEHLVQLQEALGAARDKLRLSADAYEDTDTGTAGRLDIIGRTGVGTAAIPVTEAV